MKKIAFVLPSFCLPVPCREGAVETLMTMLLNENEKKGKYQFIFISPNESTQTIKFNYSICYGISIPKTECNTLYYYDKEAAKICIQENPEYIIMEGAALRLKDCFDSAVNKRDLAIHLHSEITRTKMFEEYFGFSIAPSRYIADKFSQEIVSFLWKNAVDTKKFIKRYDMQNITQLRTRLGINKEDFVIFYCGRLVAEKGVLELIEALNLLKDINNVKLVVIGTEQFARGNSSAYSHNVVKKLSESEKCLYLGYIKNDDLPQFYQMANLQVIPSLWEEPAGLVAIEGMLSQIPIVITRSGGMVEYVSKETIIIEKDNIIENIAEAVRYVYNNYDDIKAQTIKSYEYAKQFSQEKYYAELENLLNFWDVQKKQMGRKCKLYEENYYIVHDKK